MTRANLTGPTTPVVQSPRRRGPGSWTGYAAAAWSAAFAALSFYWAAGGRLGEGTIGAAIEDPAFAREPAFVALLWITAVVKLAGVPFGLALIGRTARWAPRWMLLTAGWSAGPLILVYGVANLVQHLLMWSGEVAVPDGLGTAALPWHLLLWDPVWIVGGLLFTLAAVHFTMRTRR